jgi:hypothetical protein
VRYFISRAGPFYGDASSISILDHGGGSVNEGEKKGMFVSFGDGNGRIRGGIGEGVAAFPDGGRAA